MPPLMEAMSCNARRCRKALLNNQAISVKCISNIPPSSKIYAAAAL